MGETSDGRRSPRRRADIRPAVRCGRRSWMSVPRPDAGRTLGGATFATAGPMRVNEPTSLLHRGGRAPASVCEPRREASPETNHRVDAPWFLHIPCHRRRPGPARGAARNCDQHLKIHRWPCEVRHDTSNLGQCVLPRHPERRAIADEPAAESMPGRAHRQRRAAPERKKKTPPVMDWRRSDWIDATASGQPTSVSVTSMLPRVALEYGQT